MMELLTNPQTWIAFATLTLLELVLGIDNIIFISILVDKLPKEKREFARRIGLFMAMFMRIGLLLVLAWIVGLVTPLFSVFGMEISGRDLILILGGLQFFPALALGGDRSDAIAATEDTADDHEAFLHAFVTTARSLFGKEVDVAQDMSGLG